MVFLFCDNVLHTSMVILYMCFYSRMLWFFWIVNEYYLWSNPCFMDDTFWKQDLWLYTLQYSHRNLVAMFLRFSFPALISDLFHSMLKGFFNCCQRHKVIKVYIIWPSLSSKIGKLSIITNYPSPFSWFENKIKYEKGI